MKRLPRTLKPLLKHRRGRAADPLAALRLTNGRVLKRLRRSEFYEIGRASCRERVYVLV